MKFLLFSDLHLDALTAGMRRLADLEQSLYRVLEIAEDQDIDQAYCLGDLADADSGSIIVKVMDVLIGTAIGFHTRGIPIHWVAGNHDGIEDGSGVTTLRPLRNIEGSSIYERPATIDIGGICVSFLPYPTRITQYDPEKYIDERHGKGGMVVGHCTSLPGVRTGSESNSLARGGDLVFPLAACHRKGVKLMANGHYHHQQRTPDGVWIPGSLERLRFDEEENEPGILIGEI